MGFWSDVFRPLPSLKDIHKTKQELIEDLETASEYLAVAEDLIEDGNRLTEYRCKITRTVEVLSFPDAKYKNIVTGMKIARAVSDLDHIGDIAHNLQAAARAFGRLFGGMGELARHLPPPVNGYVAIFAEAEDYFESLRVKKQPQLRMREEEAREGSKAQGEFIDPVNTRC